MFTGLIQQIASLSRRETAEGGLRLVIECAAWNPPLVLGESVAVNGVCLTIAALDGRRFTCDLLRETADLTTLGRKRPGAALNLERALRLGDALGGHMVTGHVDDVGAVIGRKSAGRDWILRVKCDADLLRGMAPKGSIAIDGVSLTIVELTEHSFAVHLIPVTCEHTILGKLKEGDAVNLETDIIGKHVRRIMATEQAPAPLTLERLRNAGFGEG